MGLTVAAGFFLVVGFLKVFVIVQAGEYCDDVQDGTDIVDMCVGGNKTVQAGSYVYLDTTGSPTFTTVSCSCEIVHSSTTTLDIKYRTENTSACGLSFEIKNTTFGCFHYLDSSGQPLVHTVIVPGYSNLTFFRSNGTTRHVRACMGLRVAATSLQIRCYPDEAYIPPDLTTLPTTASAVTATTTTVQTSTSSTTTTTSTTSKPTVTSTTVPTTTSTTTIPTTKTSTSTTPAQTTSTTTTKTTTSTTPAETTTAGATTNASTTVVSEEPGQSTQSTGGTGGGQGQNTSTQSTPRVAEVKDTTNTAAIAGGVVGGVLGLILLIVLIVCLICLVGRQREKKKKEILFGPRTVRYNSNASSGDVQITENALYDSENPSTAMNQLFIGGIPETPGSRASELPRFEDRGPRYTEVAAVNGAKPKVRDGPNRKSSSGSDTAALKIDDEYSEIDSGISNPGYDSHYKAPYTMPYDNKLGVGTGEKAESVISSPYDYIDNEKLERDEARANTGHYMRLISDPNDQQGNAGTGSSKDRESGPGSRLGSESGPGTPGPRLGNQSDSRLGSESSNGSRLVSSSGPGSRLDSVAGPGSRLGSESSPGHMLENTSGYTNDPSPKPVFDADAHFGYDQA